MISNAQGKETQGIKIHLSLLPFFYCLSLMCFKHREIVNMLLRKLSVSIENKYLLENIAISL